MVQPHTGDVIHTCNSGNDTIDQEDVLFFHTSYQDTDGVTHTGKGPAEAMRAGAANRLQGQLAGIMGEDFEDLTPRGKRAALYRQRQKEVYKKVPNKNY